MICLFAYSLEPEAVNLSLFLYVLMQSDLNMIVQSEGDELDWMIFNFKEHVPL